ncbi:substrate-binding and VWA domain-containing protein [Dactylosporangium fulvum]|uniref:Substrate-binding and VWA domain-containing protein n=1 Tax=Dactylosporangium fulvum TaxID=53359 RepID=A0ABY5VUJ0_9ACTN|nr:substrate-binding and VWA domain-containing protein [Dactylosporangium fulvum]UWP79451.1 substrate-binding and VWA domain-containing protein [Dactylosporangium fulvum]
MADPGDHENRQKARPVVSIMVALFTGSGIFLQQLSTDEPASTARWIMLVFGSVVGGLGGLFAAGLFDELLAWSGSGWKALREWARLRYVLAVAAACLLALALGFTVPRGIDAARRWLRGCEQPAAVRVLTSTEQLTAVRQLADAYEAATARRYHGCPSADLYVYGARPADVHEAVASGWTNDALRRIGPRPDVWLPDSSLDLTLTQDAAVRFAVTVPVAERRTIGHSPVVLGVPAANVPEELAARRRELTWQQLWREATQRGWDVVRPDPSVSTPGVLATAALYTGLSADAAGARAVEQRIERSLDTGGFPLGTSAQLLCHKLTADPRRAAVIADEQAVVRFNQGLGGCGLGPQAPAPEQALVAFYPKDTVSEDRLFLRLGWDGTGTATTAAAKDFGAWLGGAEGKRTMLRSALRPPPLFDVTDPLTEQFGAQPGVAFDRRPPARETIDGSLRRYAQARRPGRILLALDASGSMQTAVDRAGTTRFQLASRGVARALELMSGRDEFGLRIFPADGGGGGARQLVPLGRADAPVGGVPRRQAAVDALAAVRPVGGTPLYPTIADGVRDVTANPDERIASLVVLTDGNDTSGREPSEVDALIRGKGARVFVVAIGEASCGALALQQLTTHTGGACYDAGPDSVDDVLVDLFGLLWGGDAGDG